MTEQSARRRLASGVKGLIAQLPGIRGIVRERGELARRVRDLERGRAMRLGSFRGTKPARLSPEDEATVLRFQELYYRVWQQGADTLNVGWLGYRMIKCPLDLWTYQELLVSLRPDFVVETGTLAGGSAYYLATILDLIGHGEVLTVDIDDSISRPSHARIHYLHGSSTSPEMVEEVGRRVGDSRAVIVILDSDHTRDHVRREMELFAPLVGAGYYLIVEDTNINGHPAYPDFGPGPMEAVVDFLDDHGEFTVDPVGERFLMTANPRGFLRRIE
jgi:cephalosporin hydroxylase